MRNQCGRHVRRRDHPKGRVNRRTAAASRENACCRFFAQKSKKAKKGGQKQQNGAGILKSASNIWYHIIKNRESGGLYVEKVILSLKNVYMLLMTEDFPIYSESVIGRNDRRGQTMLRFWQGQIAEEFRCHPCGKKIWRSDGKRNRYTSYLCNRSAEIKTYTDYAEEIAAQISVSALLSQTDRFAEFLSSRKYRHDILLRRTQELIRLAESEDPRVSREIADQIREAASWQPGSGKEKLFQAAYLLTLLTLYSAAGEAMDDPVMAVLRAKEYRIEALHDAYTSREKSRDTVFLTLHSGLLQDNSLPPHHFFGREEDLFNLKEYAASGGKLIISGVGGIGKTELLRQLIRLCVKERIVDKIAVVPYESGIIESFARCFPDFLRKTPEESFHQELYRLKKECAQGKILLLIDNLTNGPEEDPALKELTDLPCGILITTRRSALEGFETYSLKHPSASTGALIFRDNYGKPLSQEDQALLGEILTEDSFCLPLTLRLMARAAKSKGWSVRELKKQQGTNASSLTWQEDGRTVRLSQVYRQLYSYLPIPEKCLAITELFTLLPRSSYPPEFLRKWFPDTVGSNAGEILDALAEGGWLDKDSGGYAMHPLIAQCLRRVVITEDYLRPLFCEPIARLSQVSLMDDPALDDPDIRQVSQILLHVSGMISGSIRKTWLLALLSSLSCVESTPRVSREGLALISKLEPRCPDRDDHTDVRSITVRCRWNGASEEEYTDIYRRQQSHRTISVPQYLELCLFAGYSAAYFHQNYALAESLLREVICPQATVSQKSTAYGILVDVCSYQGKREEAIKICEEGYAFVTVHPECPEWKKGKILSQLLQAYALVDRKEDAVKLVPRIEKIYRETPFWETKYYLAIALDLYEYQYGSPEASYDYAKENRDLIEQMRGRAIEYYTSSSSMALSAMKMKRFDEALSLYEDTLAYARENNIPYWIWNFSHNISAVYLEMNQPKKALEYIAEAEEIAKPMGGQTLAVVYHNKARAYRQLEDPAQEYRWLKEACPLLEECYGADNLKTQAARQRLEELETTKDSAGVTG